MMTEYAQTNLQLYRQLWAGAYSEKDLELVDRAYRVAMHVFAGHYRPNRKPFVAHLVGVASILASVRQPAPMLAAGLLHSVYPLGLCRGGRRLRAGQRDALRESLGKEVEQLVLAYGERRWRTGDFRLSADEVRSLSGTDRQLYLIKLADIHEEFLDGGTRYQPGKKLLADEDETTRWLRDAASLIAGLGYAAWGERFRGAVDADHHEVPAVLLDNSPGSYVLAPGLPHSPWKDRLVQWLIRF